MSNPRNYWFSMVKKMVMNYPQLKNEHSIQSSIYKNAIEKQIEETRRLPDGEYRIQAINDIFFEKTKTVDGVAMELNYGRRTVQSWTSSFLNGVGRNAGF